MKRFLSLSVIALVIVLGLLCSCSKEKCLLESVPADVKFVAMVNLPETGNQMGFTIADGKIVLPSSLAGREIPQAVEALTALDGAADLTSIAAVCDSNLDFFFLMPVSDAGRLKELLKDAAVSSNNGFDIYALNGFTYAVKGQQLWISDYPAPDTADKLSALADRADKNPLAANSALTEFLTTDKPVNFAVSNIPGTWIAMNIAIKDGSFHGTAKTFSNQDGVLNIDSFSDFNMSLLQYISFKPIILIGSGMSKDIDWSDMFKNLDAMPELNGAEKARLSMLRPFLEAVDGSVMLAAGLKDGYTSFTDPSAVAFIAMVHMEQQKVNETIESLLQLVGSQFAVAEVSNGVYSVTIAPGLTYYLGNIDGCLTIASTLPTNNNSNNLATIFSDKRCGMVLDIPSLQMIAPQLPAFGIELKLNFADNNAGYTLRFTNTDRSPLELMLDLK